MQTTLIPIGNSHGIRIPKAFIRQLGLSRHLDVEVQQGALVIRPAKSTRDGWAAAAEQCHQSGDDRMPEWDAVSSDFAGDWG